MGRRDEPFYYAAGLRIYFTPVPDRMLLAVYGRDADRRLASAASDKTLALEMVLPQSPAGRGRRDSVLGALEVEPGSSVTDLTREIATLRDELEKDGLKVIPALPIVRGARPPLGLTQELVVQFEPGVGEERARAIAASMRLEVERPVLSTPNGYVLRDPDGPSYELLDVARRLVDDNAVLAAEPEILMPLEMDQFTPERSPLQPPDASAAHPGGRCVGSGRRLPRRGATRRIPRYLHRRLRPRRCRAGPPRPDGEPQLGSGEARRLLRLPRNGRPDRGGARG